MRNKYRYQNNWLLRLLALMVFMMGCAGAKTIHVSSNAPLEGAMWKLPLPGKGMLSMAWIKPGTFIMGSPVSETGHKTDESPETEVTLTKGFWLGKTEVTIGEWKAVTGESIREQVIKMLNDETVYDFGDQKKKLREFMNFDRNDPYKIMANESDSIPMYFVSWNDATSFCKKLTLQERAAHRLPEGYEYNLPTEAQWEFGCRAGTTDATFKGPLVLEGKNAPVLESISWYGGNSAKNYLGKGLGNNFCRPAQCRRKKR